MELKHGRRRQTWATMTKKETTKMSQNQDFTQLKVGTGKGEAWHSLRCQLASTMACSPGSPQHPSGNCPTAISIHLPSIYLLITDLWIYGMRLLRLFLKFVCLICADATTYLWLQSWLEFLCFMSRRPLQSPDLGRIPAGNAGIKRVELVCWWFMPPLVLLGMV